MANPVIVVEQPNRLRIRFNQGMDPETGKPIIRSQSWGGIKPQAEQQDVYDVAYELAQLSQHSVFEYLLEEDKSLTE